MAASTIVITYAGTLGTDEEVSSFTVDGTAYASLTALQIRTARRLLKKAIQRLNADKASSTRDGSGGG